MNLKEKIEYVRDKLKFKQAANMKEATLDKKIQAGETATSPVKQLGDDSIEISFPADSGKFLDSRGFDFKRFAGFLREIRCDKALYIPNLKYFQCFRAGKVVDSVDIGMF